MKIKDILEQFLGFPRSSVGKNLPAVQETWVRSLGGEDPLEEEMTIHSSILVWEIPWTEESSGLSSMGSQRVRHNWARMHIKLYIYMCVCIILNLLYLSYYFELHELLEMKKGILKSSTAIWLYQDLLCFKLFLDFTFQCSWCIFIFRFHLLSI